MPLNLRIHTLPPLPQYQPFVQVCIVTFHLHEAFLAQTTFEGFVDLAHYLENRYLTQYSEVNLQGQWRLEELFVVPYLKILPYQARPSVGESEVVIADLSLILIH